MPPKILIVPYRNDEPYGESIAFNADVPLPAKGDDITIYLGGVKAMDAVVLKREFVYADPEGECTVLVKLHLG